MSSIRTYFEYKELQIIKHALQTQIKTKKDMPTNDKVLKDIKEEEKLLENVTSIVDKLKTKWKIK